MERKRMIEQLIESTVTCALGDPELVWLKAMLVKGFVGYEKMSSESLKREMQLRGLLDFDDPEPEDEFDDDDDNELEDEFEDENERLVMLAGTAGIDRNATRG
jgi:hypothetical protein